MEQFAHHRAAHWEGVLKCGRQYACPVCAKRKAADRADELDRLMRGDPDGRWQMLTLTVAHHMGESLRTVLDRVVKGWRRTRATRAVRDVFSANVTASVRAIETTYGRNGWHCHVHLLLRTTEWDAEQRATLEREWRKAVPANQERGVVWSSPIEAWHKERARYVAKLGAEVSGVAKACKNGNMTQWQLAESALDDSRHVPLWQEYQTTMKGRRLLEWDERARALLERAPKKEEPVHVFKCNMFPEEFAELAKLEKVVPSILWEVLETAIHSGADPPAQVRITVDDALGAMKDHETTGFQRES